MAAVPFNMSRRLYGGSIVCRPSAGMRLAPIQCQGAVTPSRSPQAGLMAGNLSLPSQAGHFVPTRISRLWGPTRNPQHGNAFPDEPGWPICCSIRPGEGGQMPKLTVVVERTALKVYDIDHVEHPVIRVGREMGLEDVIDTVAVSRHQAESR